MFSTLKDKALITRFFAGNLSKDELAFKLLPVITLEIIKRYFRVESFGTENLPKTGAPCIYVANHSGYSGFDALMLTNEIRSVTRRPPKMVAHKLWFLGKPVRVLSEKMGLVEADLNNSLKILQGGESILLFPEGEAGNFKPSHRRYRLQEFKRGFVRLSMITGAPIVPSFVLGAEESHINLSQIKFTKYLIGTVIPVPLNVIPLPVKWSVHFLPPIDLGAKPADAMDRKKVLKVSREIKHIIQGGIVKALREQQERI